MAVEFTSVMGIPRFTCLHINLVRGLLQVVRLRLEASAKAQNCVVKPRFKRKQQGILRAAL